MKPILAHPLSLLVGAALALTIGAQAVQRTAVIAPPAEVATLNCPKTVSWPPHPEDLFVWQFSDLPGYTDDDDFVEQVSFPQGDTRLFETLVDRCLVVTSFGLNGGGNVVFVIEDDQGKRAPMRTHDGGITQGDFGETGTVMQPGSRLLLRNYGSGGAILAKPSVRGYYVGA